MNLINLQTTQSANKADAYKNHDQKKETETEGETKSGFLVEQMQALQKTKARGTSFGMAGSFLRVRALAVGPAQQFCVFQSGRKTASSS